MICSSPTPHASKLASTEKPDVVVLLLLVDVVVVRVGVVVAAALADVAVAAFACSSAHFDFTAVLRASTSHAAPCTHTRRLQTR